jgi:ParB family transcriptional regulator, chromosome partitioning protein
LRVAPTLYDKYPDGDVPPEVGEKMERIEAAVEAFAKQEYAARDVALAGALVTLANNGSVRIERGFVRAEEEPKSKAKAEDQKGKGPAKDADGLAPLCDSRGADTDTRG